MDHLRATKRIIWYLQITKYYIFSFLRSNHSYIIIYFDSDLVGCLGSRRFTFSLFSCKLEKLCHGKNVKQTL